MATVNETAASVNETLQQEIRSWLELVKQIEHQANETKDIAQLKTMTKALNSARQVCEQAVAEKEPRPYPVMPIPELEELEPIPSFKPAGKGRPVKAKRVSERLPAPIIIDEE